LGEDPFNVLPLTFHIEHGLKDAEFDNFKRYFNQLEQEKAIKNAEF
jgi:hypothetical protein